MQFRVLGQVEISNVGKPVALNRSKMGQMLCLLLVRNNETVSVDTLIEELWAERAPRSALTTLQTYVYHARKLFTKDLRFPDADRILVTRPSGYAVEVDESAVDANVFQRLVRQGTCALDCDDVESAVTVLSDALRLARGPAFAGMPIGSVLDAHVTYLQELRLVAIGLRIEAHLRLGRHREVVPELRALVGEYPLNEGFHAQLISALHECGRRAEALQAYQHLWRVLDTELGVAPNADIRRLHHQLLD